MDAKDLERQASLCTKCALHRSRRQVVFGVGRTPAKVMLIGEAPGYWEDLRGEPFVGSAGKVLNGLLELAGLSRDSVYITNVVKCRPPNNREPKDEELQACSPYLDAQLDLVSPEVIVMLGNYASSAIFKRYGAEFDSMFKAHGVPLGSKGKVLVPMFHPAAVLYKPDVKDMIEEDWRRLAKTLESRPP